MIQSIVACALYSALLIYLGATSSIMAAGGRDTVISLRDEKMTSEGSYQFSFDAGVGQTYPVATSLDLLRWTLLTNVVGGGLPVQIEDHGASRFQRRFYQVGLPTPLPIPVTNMVFIAPGTFTMGSPATEHGRDTNEGPQTVVTLSHGFWMGKYEVTQVEYINVMGSNYSFFSYDSRLPLDFQSWDRATNYCQMLSLKERAAGRLPAGYTYRLPTEAEWEYACRAGTTTPFSIGDGTSFTSVQANFDGTFPYGGAPSGRFANVTTLGGSYPPNPWGLYDMYGNVWEWCQDWYGPYPGGNVTDPQGPATGTTRVLRGGGYTSVGQGCRSAKRDSRSPSYAITIQGFRIVLAEVP